MTVISGAPMPTPRLGSAFPATGQTAVTVSSATTTPTARPTYLTPGAFAPSALYGASNFQGMGLGRAAQAGRTRYIGRPTTAGWTMSQGRGGRMGATVRPAYLHPQNFSPTVLYSAWRAQAQGLGRYGRRARLAGIERFAPSVLYGAYAVQAQGMGRYGRKRMGCCLGRYAGNRRLGGNPFSDFMSLFTPTPGGGSVTVNGQTQYVNAQGLDQSTPDPTAGQSLVSDPGAVLSYDATGLATAAASSLTSGIPWWGWALGVGAAGFLALKVLK